MMDNRTALEGGAQPGPADDSRPRLPPVALWTLILASVAAAALAITLSRVRFIQMDEFVFVRAAWLVSQGQVPYRDFFEHHTPLFYALLAPVVALLPERADTLVDLRLFCLASSALLAAGVFALCRAFAGRLEAWAATLLLFLVPGFVSRAIEIRPDVLAAAAFVAAAALLVRPAERAPIGARALAGFLMAVALLATQKSIQYSWGLVVLALLPPGRAAAATFGWWRSVLAFVLGFSAPLLGLLATLWALGAWPAFWNQNVELAWKWQALDVSFPLSRYRDIAIRGFAIWAFAVGCGLALATADLLRRGSVLNARALRLIGVAGPALASLALLPTPWPYNYLPVYAVLTPLAAFALRGLQSFLGEAARARALALLIAIGLLLQASWFAEERWRGNAIQLQLIDRVLDLTTPETPVYDENGGYLFRPAAYFLWYHSKAMRILLAGQLAHEVPPSILKSGATVWLHDPIRFRELPPTVREFVTTNYQRYLGSIHLWGAHLTPSPGQPEDRIETTFRAVRDGRYFVTLADPAVQLRPTVTIDGSSVAIDDPVRLDAGEHRIRVEGPIPAGGLFALWLPANGELWRPSSRMGPLLYPHLF